jgi:hypothetical protein
MLVSGLGVQRPGDGIGVCLNRQTHDTWDGMMNGQGDLFLGFALVVAVLLVVCGRGWDCPGSHGVLGGGPRDGVNPSFNASLGCGPQSHEAMQP